MTLLHGGERLSVSLGKGIMSTILTLNYSDSCCSDCLRTMLWIKHKDQVRIRRKPLTSAEPPLRCGGARAHTAPPRVPTKLHPHLPTCKAQLAHLDFKAGIDSQQNDPNTEGKGFACVWRMRQFGALFRGVKDGGPRFLCDGEDSHVLLTGSSCAVETPCNWLYFPFPGS